MRKIYFKLRFTTALHFGNGSLESTDIAFKADTLFSALYIEALKAGCEKDLFRYIDEGRLLFSNAFPYCEDELFLPKPVLKPEGIDTSDPADRKKFKNLSYIPVSMWDSYLKGEMEVDSVRKDFGVFISSEHAAVRREEETLPYHVGKFKFYDGCGLYFILMYESDEAYDLVSRLMELLSYSGIGGKRSSGLGRFEVLRAKENKQLSGLLDREGSRYMLLSCALPLDSEAGDVIDGASYILEKRSGFVASDTYENEWRKKRDLYVFGEGSCFPAKFKGDIYDVSGGGRHPVYRYARGMFLGI